MHTGQTTKPSSQSGGSLSAAAKKVRRSLCFMRSVMGQAAAWGGRALLQLQSKKVGTENSCLFSNLNNIRPLIMVLQEKNPYILSCTIMRDLLSQGSWLPAGIHLVDKTQFQRAPEKNKSNVPRSLKLLTFTFLQSDFFRSKTEKN